MCGYSHCCIILKNSLILMEIRYLRRHCCNWRLIDCSISLAQRAKGGGWYLSNRVMWHWFLINWTWYRQHIAVRNINYMVLEQRKWHVFFVWEIYGDLKVWINQLDCLNCLIRASDCWKSKRAIGPGLPHVKDVVDIVVACYHCNSAGHSIRGHCRR